MLKKLWFQTHWLLGISAGLVLAVMGVTGALLSFEPELLRALNPGLMSVPARETPMLTPPQLLEQLAITQPDRKIGTVSVSNIEGRAARVGFMAKPRESAPGAPNARQRMDVFFADPYTGTLLGSEDAMRGHDALRHANAATDRHRRGATGDRKLFLTAH